MWARVGLFGVLGEVTVGYVLHVLVNVCVSVCYPWVDTCKWQMCLCECVCVCVSVSCTSVESGGDQTVSQLPWEGSSGCDRVEEAKYPGSNTLLCLSHNEATSPGSDNTHKMFRHKARVRRRTETLPWPEERARKGSFHPRPCFYTCPFLHYSEISSWSYVCVCVFPHLKVTAVVILLAEIISVKLAIA